MPGTVIVTQEELLSLQTKLSSIQTSINDLLKKVVAPVVQPTPVIVEPSPSPLNGATVQSKYLTNTNVPVPFDFASNRVSKGSSVVEPTTGATIKRLTDVEVDFPKKTALFNAYSRFPVENVTEEYYLAFADDSTSCLVMDSKTNKTICSLAYDDSGSTSHTVGSYHEVRWHYTKSNPYRVYYVNGMQFCKIDDVRNQNKTRSVVKDFSSLIDWTGVPSATMKKIYMDQEGNSSLDSDHWVWMAAFYDGTTWRVRAFVHYQVSTDKVHIMYPQDVAKFQRGPKETGVYFSSRPNTVEALPDGSGALIMYERAYPGWNDKYINTVFEAPYVFPIDFNPSSFVPFRVASDATHSGWSTVNGVWHYVSQDNRRDKVIAVPVSGTNKGYGNEGQINVNNALGKGVIDIHTDGTPYPGMHFGICTGKADGWTLMSTYSVEKASQLGLGNALYMLKIVPEASTVKWHVAPTCNQWPTTNKADYNEAPASINLAGTRIFVAGDWNGTSKINPLTSTRYVDLYSIDLPSDWNTKL